MIIKEQNKEQLIYVEHFARQVSLYKNLDHQCVILQVNDGIARVHGLKYVKRKKKC